MALNRLNLSRAQLAAFLKDPESIRQFERLFSVADSDIPSITILIEEASTAAGSAMARAVQALDALEAVRDDLEFAALAPPVPYIPPTGAPTDATYIVLTANGTLTQERVLTAGANITLTDAGPGGALTIAATGGGGGAPTGAQYVTLATDATLTAERVLTAGAGISITDGGAGNPVTIACTVSPGVPTSRLINTTAPLAGGGDLTADRTLSVATFGAGASGVVPASGGGTSNFLRADGTWTAPTAAAAATEAYVDLGTPANTRRTATVVDAAVSPTSKILVSWGAVQNTDDNDPEMDDITFHGLPGTGQFTLVASCQRPIEGRVRINYQVAA
jgi:hypothetical protein